MNVFCMLHVTDDMYILAVLWSAVIQSVCCTNNLEDLWEGCSN